MAKDAFAELLDQIQDEQDRKTVAELGEKHKVLKDGYLRQSDYSRQMNALSEEKKKLEKEVERAKQWDEWRVANWVDTGDGVGMTKSEQEAQQKLQEVNAELEILKAAQEAGMTFEEVGQYIDKELGKKNVLTKADLEKEFTPRLDKVKQDYQKELTERVTSIANGLEYLYEETYPLGFSHREEFGEVLKPRELVEFANQNGIKEISKAYEAWVSPKRAEIQKKKTEELVAAAKEEGRKEALKEKGMGQGGKLPVDQGPPAMGHLERKLRTPKDQQEKDPIPEDMPLGKGVSSIVAQLYRKNTAEGVTVTE